MFSFYYEVNMKVILFTFHMILYYAINLNVNLIITISNIQSIYWKSIYIKQ